MVVQKYDAQIAKAMGSEAVRETEGLVAENVRLKDRVAELEKANVWQLESIARLESGRDKAEARVAELEIAIRALLYDEAPPEPSSWVGMTDVENLKRLVPDQSGEGGV